MTALQLLPPIGTKVMVRMESLVVECKVLDAKNAYGRVRLLINPVSGSGAQWVLEDRVVRAKNGAGK